MKLRTLTLEEYSKRTEKQEAAPLYIINTAHADTNGQNTQIAVHFSVKSENGGLSSLNVPATWIPIDLTARVHRNLIVGDPNFRDLLQKGHLTIVAAQVTEDEQDRGLIGAEDAYKDSQVREEFADLFGSSYALDSDASSSKASDDSDNSITIGKTIKANATTASDIAQNIVDRCQNNEPAKTILRTIRQKAVSLSPADYRYIMQNASDAGIKQHCAEQLG